MNLDITRTMMLIEYLAYFAVAFWFVRTNRGLLSARNAGNTELCGKLVSREYIACTVFACLFALNAVYWVYRLKILIDNSPTYLVEFIFIDDVEGNRRFWIFPLFFSLAMLALLVSKMKDLKAERRNEINAIIANYRHISKKHTACFVFIGFVFPAVVDTHIILLYVVDDYDAATIASIVVVVLLAVAFLLFKIRQYGRECSTMKEHYMDDVGLAHHKHISKTRTASLVFIWPFLFLIILVVIIYIDSPSSFNGLFLLPAIFSLGAIIVFFSEAKRYGREKKAFQEYITYAEVPSYGISGQGKINRTVRISLFGGLIGSAATNPRRKLEDVIRKFNGEGWNCHQIIPHQTHNILAMVLQTVLLLITLGMFTFGGAYLLVMEKDATDSGGTET
jgi:Ca2+/Na+ antiporter